MPMLTLGQAARLTGFGKTTITRAIKAGRLSATRRDEGGYAIDPAELCRVYPPGATSTTVASTSDATPNATPHDPEIVARLATLEAEVCGLRELLAEVRASRDAEREQHRMVLAALPKPANPAPQDAPQSAASGHWRPFGRRRGDMESGPGS